MSSSPAGAGARSTRRSQALGQSAVAVVGDNADPQTAERLVDTAKDTWGRLDGALISVGGPPGGSVMDTPDDTWRSSFESVFVGALRIARAVAHALDGPGSIAFVLSSSVRSPIPDLAVSNGLRPGLAMAAKTLADELGPREIRVNGLLPGRVATDRTAALDAATGDADAAMRRSARRDPTASLRKAGGVRRHGGVRAQPGVILRQRRDDPRRRRHAPDDVNGLGPVAA